MTKTDQQNKTKQKVLGLDLKPFNAPLLSHVLSPLWEIFSSQGLGR